MPPTRYVPGLRARWDEAPDVDALAKRVAGARGVHAAVWLRAATETLVLLFLESVAMRDAYALWLRDATHPPDQIDAVELLAAAPGRSGAAPLVELLLGSAACTTVHR